MPTLFTYCIPIDDGAAPNPFWGTCTLVICKPRIRSVAKVIDWIVGTGSLNSPIGEIGGQVVYAMRVSQKMTMEEYDHYVKEFIPNKIPKWFSQDVRRRLGDAIYDFSVDPPSISPSVHNENQRKRDLGGKFALLSDHYFYFGGQPKQLPELLLPIVKQGAGHRSKSNDPYVKDFLAWMNGLKLILNKLSGKPQYRLWKEDLFTFDSPC